MTLRLDYFKTLPEGMKPVLDLDRYCKTSGLEPLLLELMKIRASQLNGCAYCLDMHSKDARSRGETEQRIYGLSAWHETPYYSERERAALALTEAVTLLANTSVTDEVYHQVQEHFSDEEIVKLVLCIVSINTWNRFAVTFRNVPGSYKPQHFAAKSGQPAEDKAIG